MTWVAVLGHVRLLLVDLRSAYLLLMCKSSITPANVVPARVVPVAHDLWQPDKLVYPNETLVALLSRTLGLLKGRTSKCLYETHLGASVGF